mmetsp:Transcript_7011/g.26194  ORF Transcript_7011/g.26194 Transcript_7011/m.26194 type:complete len:240 (-) Transcript_7011:426-1145(-)
MTGEAWRDWISSTTSRSHGCHKLNIGYGGESAFFAASIEPSTMILPLAQQFNWWLCTVHFWSRKIEVIHKNNHFLANSRSHNSSLAFHKLGLNDILSLICTGARRKVEECWMVQAISLIEHIALDVGTLSRSSWTDKKNLVLIFDQNVQQERVTRGVNSWHDNLLELNIVGDWLVLHCIEPIGPALLVHIKHIIVHSVDFWQFCAEIVRGLFVDSLFLLGTIVALQLVTKEFVKLCATL